MTTVWQDNGFINLSGETSIISIVSANESINQKFRITVDITKYIQPVNTFLDILKDTYIYTDWCMGPFYSGPTGDDLYTWDSSLTLYPTSTLADLNIVSLEITFVFPSTHPEVTIYIHDGSSQISSLLVAANALTATLTSTAINFTADSQFYIGQDYGYLGGDWGITSIIAEVTT
jgi:hypothetical protein